MKTVQNNETKKNYKYVVSLDAHKRTYSMKIQNTFNKQVLFNGGIAGDIKEVISRINIFNLPKKDVVVLYEAGCVGFHPHAALKKQGYHCLVIAPSSIPYNNRNKKTDKHDCKDNLNYHLSGILRYVTVPDDTTIQLREMYRYRDSLVEEIRRKQQHISAFTLRNGFIFKETKSDWSAKHRKWLKGLELDPILKSTLDFMLADLEHIELTLDKTERQIDQYISVEPVLKRNVDALKLLPGIGSITSQGIVLECGDLNKFGKAIQVPQFLGLVPGKQQSGSRDPALAITKEGNKNARRLMISASKFYGDQRRLYSEKELDALPATIAEFIKRMQDRLNERYRNLKCRGKHINKVRCAIARELAMFIWDYMVHIVPNCQIEPLKKVA